MPHKKSNQRKRFNRSGTTTVEFALVIPVVFIFFFGLWEWSRVEMIRQVSETATFEAARVGTLPGKTEAEAIDAANLVFERYFISSPSVACVITTKNETATVTVEVPLDENTWITAFYYAGKSIHTNIKLHQ